MNNKRVYTLLDEKFEETFNKFELVKASLDQMNYQPCSTVSFDVLSDLKQQQSRLLGYMAALEFAKLCLEEKD